MLVTVATAAKVASTFRATQTVSEPTEAQVKSTFVTLHQHPERL